MRDHESAMLSYIRLAEMSQRRRQLLGRDKLLVLASAAACRAGWPEVAERCRQLVLEHNPAHLIGNFPSVADALRSEDFAPLLKQHERLCGYERAEFLANDLGLKPDIRPEPDDKTPGQIALELLSSSPPQV
jgi:hypothetical protein